MPKNTTEDPDLADTPLDDAAEAGEAPAAAPGGPAGDLTAVLQEKQALQDRLLRTAAEFDNYRKRIDRERRELSEYAAADVLTDLLPIVDDLERALQAQGGDANSYRQGVELIHKQMLELLRKRGVKPIDTTGATFDPNFHQAVIHEASPDHREGDVMQELRRGYMLGERLLRPAMVKVAKAS